MYTAVHALHREILIILFLFFHVCSFLSNGCRLHTACTAQHIRLHAFSVCAKTTYTHTHTPTCTYTRMKRRNMPKLEEEKRNITRKPCRADKRLTGAAASVNDDFTKKKKWRIIYNIYNTYTPYMCSNQALSNFILYFVGRCYYSVYYFFLRYDMSEKCAAQHCVVICAEW